MEYRRPGEGRYAKVEREQRWLLATVPSGVTDKRDISDQYFLGTTLRLRRIQAGSDVIFKLGQKVRVDDSNPELIMVTNLYLSSDEYDRMLAIASATVTKSRWTFLAQRTSYAVDEFSGRHAGLIMAEVEIDESSPRLPAPDFARLEVTDDDRYSGGSLAAMGDSEIRELLG